MKRPVVVAVVTTLFAPGFAMARVPPPMLVEAPAELALTGEGQARVDELLDGMRSAEETAGTDPRAGLAEFDELLERIESAPELSARSDEIAEDRTFTALTIAGVLLEAGHEAEAARLVDYVIRTSHGEPAPVDTYSKSVRALYDECLRHPELAPIGSVAVTCTEPCRVVLDERVLGDSGGGQVDELPLGEHRLYVESLSQATPPVRQRLSLTGNDTEFSLRFGPPRSTPDDASTTGRNLPRWAAITGVAAGVVLLVTGATLLALHDTCPDGSDPQGPDACEQVYDTVAVGSALTAIGGGAMLGFSVVLGIDEVRAGRGGGRTEAHVGLGYTLRF